MAMTHRCYGDWPGWWIEAGWTDEFGGYYFCSMSKFDGNHETEFNPDWHLPRESLTVDRIEEWLLGQAQRWPEVAPPPNFIEDLRGDAGNVTGPGMHVSVHYDPSGQRFYRSPGG